MQVFAGVKETLFHSIESNDVHAEYFTFLINFRYVTSVLTELFQKSFFISGELENNSK